MRSRDLAALVGLGASIEACYLLLLALPFGLLERYQTPSLDFGKATGYSRQGGLTFLLATGGLFLACILAAGLCRRLGRDRQAPFWVFGFAALHALTLVLSYPLGSTDMVAYLLQSRVFTHHGANPMLVPPSAFPEDPLFASLTYWLDEPSIYGPAWVIIGAAVSLLAGDSLLAGLLGFKILAAAAWLLSAAAVYVLVSHWRPREALGATVLLAWNPLVAFESAAGGHNDVIMALPALLALLAFARGRFPLAMVLLALSALVKFVTVVLFPAFLLAWLWPAGERRARLRAAAAGVLLAGLLVVALYAPFWEGVQSIGPLRRGQFFTASPWAALYFWLLEQGYTNAAELAGRPAVLLFVAFTLWRTLLVSEGAEKLATAAFDVVFAYLALASSWFQPWYLAFLVPFGVLAPDATRRNLALLFSASATLNYFVFFFLWPWNRQWWEMLPGQVAMATAVFVPPLIYLAWVLWRQRTTVVGTARAPKP